MMSLLPLTFILIFCWPISDSVTIISLSDIQTKLNSKMKPGYLAQYEPGSQCDLLQTTFYCLNKSQPPVGSYSYEENGANILTITCDQAWVSKTGDDPCLTGSKSKSNSYGF